MGQLQGMDVTMPVRGFWPPKPRTSRSFSTFKGFKLFLRSPLSFIHGSKLSSAAFTITYSHHLLLNNDLSPTGQKRGTQSSTFESAAVRSSHSQVVLVPI